MSPVHIRFTLCLVAGLSGVAWPQAPRAADPQPYQVTLAPTGNASLDSALHDSSSLIALGQTAPVGGFALVFRAREDVDRFQQALHSFGYYKAKVDLTVADRDPADPALVELIDRAPATPAIPIKVQFELGPLFHVGKVTFPPDLPPQAASAASLRPGEPAVASDVLVAQGRLLGALRDEGYPMAEVPIPIATLRLDSNSLDIAFQATPGQQANLGAINFSGLKDMNESFLRRRLLIHSGERFNPDALEAARRDLASLGVFSVVRLEPGSTLDAQGNLPIMLDVTERPLHAVDVGAAYSTDLGINLTSGWHHRNLFGNAEQLNLTGAVTLGGRAVTKPGYQANAQFLKPDFLARDQSLEIDFGAIKQSLLAYDQTALTQKIGLNRRFSAHWNGSVAVTGEQESITQQGITRHYNLLGVPLTARYDNTDSTFDPTTGVRAMVMVQPTESFGKSSSTFFITQVSGSTYFDLSNNGRTILAARALVGQASGVGVFGLPPDQRFYAGGSGTVRGYRYQTVGPLFPNGRPQGGTAVSAGSIELRQRFLSSYGVVAFVDAGQVSSTGAPFTSNWNAGAGVGARYYTAIGPIRLDVAMPLNRRPGDDNFELYIGIGHAF